MRTYTHTQIEIHATISKTGMEGQKRRNWRSWGWGKSYTHEPKLPRTNLHLHPQTHRLTNSPGVRAQESKKWGWGTLYTYEPTLLRIKLILILTDSRTQVSERRNRRIQGWGMSHTHEPTLPRTNSHWHPPTQGRTNSTDPQPFQFQKLERLRMR